MGIRRILAAAVLAAAMFGAGCGGDDDNPVEGGAIGLTEWLPTGATSYTSIDIAAYKEDLDLPADADPMKVPELGLGVAGPFSYLLSEPSLPSPGRTGKPLRPGAVLDAVDPTAVTSAAASGSPGRGVAVLATVADEGEIGSRLGDIGYRDSAGVLVRNGGEPAIRLEEGLVFASDDPQALRAIPDEQRDDPPLELLGELDGADIAVSRIDGGCFTESGAARRVDGTAELAVLVPGGAEPDGMQPDTDEVGEADADGEIVVKPVVDPPEGEGARSLLTRFLPSYDCG